MTVWDNAFEISPANSDAANQGAAKIRELKTAISERLELEMNFKTGTKPLIKAGIASVCYPGNTAQINALSSPANYALAFNTQTKTFMYYSSGWANAQVDHGSLYGLTGTDHHTQYLNLTKAGQILYANLDVDTGIKIDGVDIGAANAALTANIANCNSNLANHVANKANVAHTGGIGNAFGSWSSTGAYVANSNYTASTDGIVVCTAHSSSIAFYTPADDLLYKAYAVAYSAPSEETMSIMCPVRKSATWRFQTGIGGGSVYIFFLPVGS